MESPQKQEQLINFLHNFNQKPIILNKDKQLNQIEQFVITYLGMCYVQGYRIIQKISSNIFIMSLMLCQGGGSCLDIPNQSNQLHSIYRIVSIQYDFKLNQDQQLRTQKYQQIINIMQFLCSGHCINNCKQIQVHLLSASNFQYVIINGEILTKCQIVASKNFYNRDYGIHYKNRKQKGIIDVRKQGSKLHTFIQMYLKSSGLFYNQQYLLTNVLYHSKFNYHLYKIINTICFIVGKQMIQGNYMTISVQKWMRKYSKMQYKKFDLLLRNQTKACIIDWKFTYENADQKIIKNQFAIKNKQYFQIARKQYNVQVSLKFYCLHQPSSNYHHQYTDSLYNYTIQNIQINDQESCNNQNSQIQIDSDSVEFCQQFIYQKQLKSHEEKQHLPLINNKQNSIQQIYIDSQLQKVSLESQCDELSDYSILNQDQNFNLKQQHKSQFILKPNKKMQNYIINDNDHIQNFIIHQENSINIIDSNDNVSIQQIQQKESIQQVQQLFQISQIQQIAIPESEDESNNSQDKNVSEFTDNWHNNNQFQMIKKYKNKANKQKANYKQHQASKNSLIKIKKYSKRNEKIRIKKQHSKKFEIIDESSSIESSIEQITGERYVNNKNKKISKECHQQFNIKINKNKQRLSFIEMLQMKGIGKLFRKKLKQIKKNKKIKKNRNSNKKLDRQLIKKGKNQQKNGNGAKHKIMEIALQKQKCVLEID